MESKKVNGHSFSLLLFIRIKFLNLQFYFVENQDYVNCSFRKEKYATVYMHWRNIGNYMHMYTVCICSYICWL